MLLLITTTLVLLWIFLSVRRKNRNENFLLHFGSILCFLSVIVFFLLSKQFFSHLASNDPSVAVVYSYRGDGIYLLLVSAFSYSIGTLIRRRGKTVPSVNRNNLRSSIDRLEKFWFVPIALNAAYIYLQNYTALLNRSTYQITGYSSGTLTYKTIFDAIMPVATFALISNLFRLKGIRRFLTFIFFALIFATVFSTGSRVISILPLFVVIAMKFNSKRPNRGTIFLSIFTSVTFLVLALGFRIENSSFGLFPYINTLFNRPGAVLSSGFGNLAGNIGFSVPLTEFVYNAPDIPLNYLLTDVNPLPGSLTNWGEISTHLRVHHFIPYNGVGELANLGLLWLVLVFFVKGFITENALYTLRKSGYFLSAQLCLLLSAFSLLLTLQYNLRSSLRFDWLILMITLISILRRNDA